MFDNEKRREKEEQKERVRKRMQVSVDPDNYEYIPAREQPDYYDDESNKRVGIYVRVSTDDVRQTTSYELQKKYYEEFVTHHPNWTLVNIYADEGISGTSLKHRDSFMRMITDARSGKLDMIITKSVSRFARNVVDFIGMVRDLAALSPPVGVFFESEALFSLNEDHQLTLTFMSSMAEEESHTRSRSMETSLRMRLDNGIPLTPKLLGYTHDAEGNLIINPDEAPTVKLAFFMYLYGYSTQQIAGALIALGRKSYLGNIKWTSSSITQILRNERHCGEVLTRKTYTENYRTHKKLKNRGNKPQSRYKNHHEAIVSRDDFIAVQRMLDNAKYGNTSILPELRVIDSGYFKGFVTINPRWAAFKEQDYLMASRSVYSDDEVRQLLPEDSKTVDVSVEPGDFDLRDFEIARMELFDYNRRPSVSFEPAKINFSSACVKKLADKNCVEMLVNPITRQFAIRPAEKGNRSAVSISKLSDGRWLPKPVACAAFGDTLYSIFGWNPDNRYRIAGAFVEQGDEIAFIFDVENCETFVKPYLIPTDNVSENEPSTFRPLTPVGKHIRAIPQDLAGTFGKQFYIHEQSLAVLAHQSESDWKLRMQGQLFDSGNRLNVTSFDELKEFISQELEGTTFMEVIRDGQEA